MAVPYILKDYCTELADDYRVVAIGDDKSDEDIFAALPVRP
jgi:trehalose-6-phosphatase